MNRLVVVIVAMLVIAPLTVAKEPAPYPERTIRIIIPGVLGGPPDLVGRIIADKLSARLGQQVIIENRPGGTGIIGLQAVAMSAPDGYTLGMIAMPYLVMAGVVPKVPFDIEKDFAPVALVNWQYSILAVPAGSRMNSVADIVAAAKANPGGLKFSSSGNGTPGDIAGRLFQRDANLTLTHVPYKGAQPAVLGLLTGEVDLTISAVGPLSPHIKGGKLRALATIAPQRIRTYPELPTFAELGYPQVQIRDWQGIIAPAKTPNQVIEVLHAAIANVTQTSEVRDRLEMLGMEVATWGPEAFAAHIRSEVERSRTLVRELGLKAEK